MDLLQFNENGIYCPPADIYIDPWRKVARAIVTHGHSDHARWGMGAYLCTPEALPVIRHRLGNITAQTLAYGDSIEINGVRISLHPAGHIVGSAQVRVEYQGEVWVAAGDYKTVDDGISTPFEPVACHTFITESTFGLPVYQWKPQADIFADIHEWWRGCQQAGKVAVLTGYALGKAQRLLANLDASIGPIYTHGAIETVNAILRNQGIALPETQLLTAATDRKALQGALVLAPPSAPGTNWLKKLGPSSTGMASGWMALRGARRRRSADRGFVLSDHADWEGLNAAIRATGAQRVLVTHGYTHLFAQWLQTQGLDAAPVSTHFVGESIEAEEPESPETGKEAEA